MKKLCVKRDIIVPILAAMLLIYGVQGISYAQDSAPTVTPGEINTYLVIKFQITLDEGVDENAYQIQLRRKSPPGRWISKCIVIIRGEVHAIGDLGVFAEAERYGGSSWFGLFRSGWSYSKKTFNITTVFTDLDPGTSYEARYRDTNLPICTKNPPSPDPWSVIAEGTTHLVTPPLVEFVDANLANGVRKELNLLTGEHIELLRIPVIELLRIPEKALAKETEFYVYTENREITDLTGLERASEVTYLRLRKNKISDISPLAQLTQLKELYLSENNISDISSLTQLTQLTKLDLRENQINDVPPLSTLVSLETLLLWDNPITDTSPLRKLLRENPNLEIYVNSPIMIVPERERDIYWVEDEKIRQVSHASTHVQDFVTGVRRQTSIALDVAGGKIYWTNRGIQRANLDGTHVENLVSGVSPDSIDLDVSGSKIYWTNWQENRIQRANLDGTHVETLITELEWPKGIALDVARGKMYWTDWEEGKIQRANFDGTDIEDVISELRFISEIALDVAGGKIYWTNRGIQRANLDGTNTENLVSEVEPEGIALDVAGGKIYWTVDSKGYSSGKIQRANFDGTDIEDVIMGLNDPSGIALSGSLRFPVPTKESFVPNVENTQITEPLESVNAESRNHRTEFETNTPQGYTRITLSNRGTVYGIPEKYTTDSDHGTMAYMLLGKLKGCDFATAELSRQSKVHIKTQVLGRLNNFTSETVCGVRSSSWSSSWNGVRITHLRFFDDGSSPNIQEALYNAATGQYELISTITPETPVDTDAIVSISPAPVASPAVGEQIAFTLNITDGEAIAGYQATVEFDTTALRFVSGTNADYLPAGAFFVQPKVEGNLVQLNAASLAGESNGDGTLATLTFEVIEVKTSTLTLSDVLLSNTGGETFVPQIENAEITEPTVFVLKGDVNGDGTVNIADLVLVASNLSKTGQNIADVNGDGQVNIVDLVLVAGALGKTAAAPSLLHPDALEMLTSADVRLWLTQAQQLGFTDTTSQRGILFLEQLLTALIPKEMVLLPNFPNPFNPETWIPYQLAEPAEVTLHIYGVDGRWIQTLALGHQPAGIYQSRSRAAYWDGRNEIGESVASGLYFYTLTADDFTATRKMVILK